MGDQTTSGIDAVDDILERARQAAPLKVVVFRDAFMMPGTILWTDALTCVVHPIDVDLLEAHTTLSAKFQGSTLVHEVDPNNQTRDSSGQIEGD